MIGSLTLSDYPGEIVRLSCGRTGQYRKQNLIERYRANIRLPDLQEEIAQRCEARPRIRIALRKAHQHADQPHPARLLRARREGHAAAAPPRTVMNSRRFTIAPAA